MTITKQDLAKIWKEVQANNAALRACPVHRFRPKAKDAGMAKLECERCGGWLERGQAMNYVRGWKAAGGDPEAVWPGVGDLV